MDLIASNPFYVLGLTANASERVIQKQVATISAYARVGRSVESEVDFPVLSLPVRNEQNVNLAVSKIEQPADRLYHSLFWFINATHIDKTALGYLRNDDAAKAAEIWELALKGKPLGPKNFSAAHNLSTLQFLFAFSSGSVNRKILLPAIRLKGKVLADCFSELSRTVIGEKVSVDQRALFRLFAGDFLKNGDLIKRGIQGFIDAFEDFPQDTRSYIEGRISSVPSARIRRAIDSAETRREKYPEKANTIGFELYEASRDDLDVVRDVHGKDHPQFQVIANDLANEILQCSIDYFNEYIESDTVDPGEDASYLIRIARSIGPSGAVKHRLDENAPVIEDWMANAGVRSAQRAAKPEIDRIFAELSKASEGPVSAAKAAKTVEQILPILEKLSRIISPDEEIYRQLSEMVVRTTIGMTIASVNSAQEFLVNAWNHNSSQGRALGNLKNEVLHGNEVLSLLSGLHMSSGTKRQHRENSKILRQMANDLGVSVKSVPSSVSSRDIGGRTGDSRTFGWIRSIEDWAAFNPLQIVGVAILFVVMLYGSFALLSSFLSNSRSSNNSTAPPVPPARMVLVPGTTFMMGSTISYNEVERPAHSVTVKPFFIDVYEVTNREFIEFSEATGHPLPWKGRKKTPALDHPVVGVTYNDALAFAKWKGKRLPTEEEWELAASGRDHYKYPWGHTWVEGRANVVGSGFKGLSPVGTFGSSYGFGLSDAIGNAWEWTSSDFRPYPGGKLPKEYDGKSGLKTLRGGSFSSTKDYATTLYRIGWPPSGAPNYDQIGFRLAMDAPNSGQKDANTNNGRNR